MQTNIINFQGRVTVELESIKLVDRKEEDFVIRVQNV